MAEITAAAVKELRDKSGAGMMDCKKALVETAGDIEAAIDLLRKKGQAEAAKKAARAAAQGLVAVRAGDGKGVVVEVNSETDFVARNEAFQAFVASVAAVAYGVDGNLAALGDADFPGTGRTVADETAQMVATIGENLKLRRAAGLAVEEGVVASYVHNQAAPDMGKIGVLVALASRAPVATLAPLGKQLAMHVAATQPQFASIDAVDPAALERERVVLTEQARESGKPDEIVAKMVDGRLRKYFEDVVLLEQTYVIDGETKVKKILDDAAKAAGTAIEIAGFVRFTLGEGVAGRDDDFAAEVAELAG